NGQAIVDSGDLPARIALARPGDKLALEVWRQGRPEQLSATLQGARPADTALAQGSAASHGKLGLSLRPLQADEKRQTRLDEGLVVEQASGAAALAGVQPGDVVLSINGQPASSVEKLRAVLAKADKSVALLIERDGQQLFVPVPLA
ncbi:MAG TPA: PDZ domain-containing protein, partial [Ottowia sp.]|nr:PDZ domain-containing protein [Ottowia sp.]